MARNSKLTSDGFGRFPHTMKCENGHSFLVSHEGWFYEEPQGFSVCTRQLPNGPTVMFSIPRRAILTYVRHAVAAERKAKEEK